MVSDAAAGKGRSTEVCRQAYADSVRYSAQPATSRPDVAAVRCHHTAPIALPMQQNNLCAKLELAGGCLGLTRPGGKKRLALRQTVCELLRWCGRGALLLHKGAVRQHLRLGPDHPTHLHPPIEAPRLTRGASDGHFQARLSGGNVIGTRGNTMPCGCTSCATRKPPSANSRCEGRLYGSAALRSTV